MQNLTHRWIQSNLFSQNLMHFFNVQKKAGETYPLIHLLFERLSVKEGTRRGRGSEPGPRIVHKWFYAKKKKKKKKH